MKTRNIAILLILAGLFLPRIGSPLIEQLLEIPAPAPQLKLGFNNECLKYEVKWSGFRAAEAWVCSKTAGQNYQMKGYARTTGLPRTLWRMDDWGEVETDLNFGLVKYNLHTRESFLNLDIEMTYNPAAKVASVKRVKRVNPPSVKFKQIELYQGFEPAGLAALVRNLEWNPGQKRYFEFTDGAERYVILLVAGPVETVTVAAGTFKAIRLDPYLFRVPRRKGKETPELLQSIRDLQTWKQIADYARIWMAVDGARPFVLVKGRAFIGEITLELVDSKAQMPPIPSAGK